MDARMYETLNALPLFVGMNAEDLVAIIHHENITVDALEANEVFVLQGESCAKLAILMRGKMLVSTATADGQMCCEEEIAAPVLLEPDILYGIQRSWSSTIKAMEDCYLLLVEKNSVTRLMGRSEIFRLNYLNTLSSLSARRRQRLWAAPMMNPQRRLLQFLVAHTMYHLQGAKRFTAPMRYLGDCLGMSRKQVGLLLAELSEEGVLSYGRSEIIIPDIKTINQKLYGTT